MTTTSEIIEKLRAPFPESQISWKVGRKTEGNLGQALPYIDNRLVQNRLDEVLGAGNWSNSYHEVVAGNRLVAVRCRLALKLDGEWVSKEDGAPLNDGELAVKGVYSDAMKRAVVQWGIGRYLYAFVPPVIALDEHGRLTRIPTLSEGMGTEEERKAATAANEAAAATAKAAATSAAGTDKPTAKKDPAPAPAAAKEEKPVAAETQPEKTEVKSQPSVAQEVLAPAAEAAAPAQAETPVAETPAPAPQPQAAAQAPAAAAAPAESTSTGATLTDADIKDPSALYVELKGKLVKLPPNMVRTYINGPKGKEKLSEAERTVLLAMVAEREKTLAATA